MSYPGGCTCTAVQQRRATAGGEPQAPRSDGADVGGAGIPRGRAVPQALLHLRQRPRAGAQCSAGEKHVHAFTGVSFR